MTNVIEVRGYTRQMNAIAFIKLIRHATGKSLAPAKELVDGLLEGRWFELSFNDSESAAHFLKAATDLGAVVARKET